MEDLLYRFKDFYYQSPGWIKRLAGGTFSVLPSSIRYGKEFIKFRNLLKKSQWWDKEKLQEYQMQKLGKLLQHAFKNVPYYAKIFNEYELRPKDIQTLEDLKKLPFLHKETIRENLHDLVATNVAKTKRLYTTTGGSTGQPLGLYLHRGISRAKESAFMFTQWERVGYKIGDRCVVLRGNVVPSSKREIFWSYEPINNSLIMSAYHLSPKLLPQYVDKIKKFKPRFIQAYPSAAYLLGVLMKENGIKPFEGIKALLCSSENLYPFQRKLLEEVFGCRVFSWYGHTEKTVLGGECEYKSYYHIFPEYGIMELIPVDGDYSPTKKQFYEIVGTNLDNWVMPLIRYRTQDLAVSTEETCPCHRDYPLLQRVEGRLQELIVAKDGHRIPLAPAIFSIHNPHWTKVREIQFVQEREGWLIINVVKNPKFSDEKVKETVKGIFEKTFDDLVNFEINAVGEVEKTENGKRKYLIQKLPIQMT